MSNFDFLQEEWNSLYQKTLKAEARVYTEPRSAAQYSRLALEESVHLLYDMERLPRPYNKDLHNLMAQPDFGDVLADAPANMLSGLHIVRKTGNQAAHHARNPNPSEVLTALRYLYVFLKWFAEGYSEEIPVLPGRFDEGLVPQEEESQRRVQEIQQEKEREEQKLREQIEQLLAEKQAMLEKAQEDKESLRAYKEKETRAKKALQQKKQRRQGITGEFTEAETRVHLIDVALREAGWEDLQEGRELEYPVKGMPITRDNPHGNGFADYVLWGRNGKPLAVIEAKRTSKNVEAGRQQARLYADCLEQMHGQRPLIFYTNGYEIRCWEDTFYSSPRQVYGFYTIDELEWCIRQRSDRKDIRRVALPVQIAGRPYQLEAIRRVAEAWMTTDTAGNLRGSRRDALLVMATGSGKTRTAAALAEVLFRYGWVRRVLFLADRTALVSQAKNSFGEHLKEYSLVDLTREKEKPETRIVFSTYPTMLNCIDAGSTAEGITYSTGHFDLIIIDEAHRSVYNRYRALFAYFDALLLGLTATPKDHIDRNTFELFGCSSGDPTFEFSLAEAVPTYLKPFRPVDTATDFIREGIRYEDLPEEEKEAYEETFGDKVTGVFPEEIKAHAMNQWLFNKDTVHKVLDALMDGGLKIEGGDQLGRSIIFAVNQTHAQFIVDCFTVRYPEKPAGFIAAVHNQVSHAQSLIDAFCDPREEKAPHIVVSVDMMDTGIDAPRVLNLVFFKVVRSYAKFWQMIGRGTRLCEDVFGPDQPKEYFLIFDVCRNFDFFSVHQKGKKEKAAKPVTRQLFEARLELSQLLTQTGTQEDVALSTQLLDQLHQSVQDLDRERFVVRMQQQYVDRFAERPRWNGLTQEDIHRIQHHLSALPVPEDVPEVARRFDLMMLKLQIANLVTQGVKPYYQDKLMMIATELSKKYTIPAVTRSRELIEEMKEPAFYQKVSTKKLERLREEIRELMQYLEHQGRMPVYTNFEDSEIVPTFGEEQAVYTTASGSVYKDRVARFVRENKHHLTIAKLRRNQPITAGELQALEGILFDGEERGSREEYVQVYGERPLGDFIRGIVGLDAVAVEEAFKAFLQAGNLSADQMAFIRHIITYLTKNGRMANEVWCGSPFTNRHDQGLTGVFLMPEAQKIVQIIEEINGNARVG